MAAFRVCDEGVTVMLKVTPRARRNAVGSFAQDADGETLLTVSVTEAPEKGAANAAVIKLLAKTWGLRKSDMDILRGDTERRKLLLIRGDGAALMRTLEAATNDTKGTPA